jgi:hypothetical protein
MMGRVVWVRTLLRCFLLFNILAAVGCLLASPPLYARDGYMDIYLSHQRSCRQCMLEPAEAGYTRLSNREGKSITVKNSDILGRDVHPIQRRMTDAFVRNLNPVVSYTLFPEAHYGANNGFYGQAYSAPYYWQGTTPPVRPYAPEAFYHVPPQALPARHYGDTFPSVQTP